MSIKRFLRVFQMLPSQLTIPKFWETFPSRFPAIPSRFRTGNISRTGYSSALAFPCFLGFSHQRSLLKSERFFSEPEPLVKSESFFSEPEQLSNNVLGEGKEKRRVAYVMKEGFKFLLSSCNVSHDSINQHSLLCLKVIIELDYEDLQERFNESAVETRDNDVELPTYELKAQDAVILLLEYMECWIHSYSIVQVLSQMALKMALKTLHDRVLSSYECGLENTQNNLLEWECTEVVFFVLVDGHIDDQGISDRKQLKEFLKEIENKMLRVQATCSRFPKNDIPNYS